MIERHVGGVAQIFLDLRRAVGHYGEAVRQHLLRGGVFSPSFSHAAATPRRKKRELGMAQNHVVEMTYDWTEISNADVDKLTIQNLGPADVEIIGNTDSTEPQARNRGLRVPRTVALVNMSMSDIFPGNAAHVRLFARIQDRDMPGKQAEIFFSHSDA